MNVSLTPEIEKFIAEQVDAGRYRSASEVVRAGMRLLQDEIREREVRLEALRRALDSAVAELDEDGGISGDQVFDEILAGLEDEGDAT